MVSMRVCSDTKVWEYLAMVMFDMPKESAKASGRAIPVCHNRQCRWTSSSTIEIEIRLQ